MARRLGDSATLLEVLLSRQGTISSPDTLAERLANATEAEALAEQLGDPVGRLRSAGSRLIPAVESADLAEYTRCLDTYTALAAQIAQPTLQWMSSNHQSVRLLLAGDAKRAEALAEDNLHVGTEIGQPDAYELYAALIGPVRWHQGRSAELIEMTEVLVADNPGMPAIRAGLARNYAEAGRDDDAHKLLAAETAAGFPFPHELGQLVCLAFWAEAAARVGDAVAAEILYQRLAPWHGQVACTPGAIYGSVAHYLGHLATVLGRYDTAEAHFSNAQTIHEHLQAPLHLARTHLEWGRMLLTRAQPEDRDAAQTHLESALDLAHRYGCARVEQRAAELLRQL